MNENNDLCSKVVSIAQDAGHILLQYYCKQTNCVEYKKDGSPVTSADLAAHHFIVKALDDTGYPVISEESAEAQKKQLAKSPCYWLVDPLDGTKEFMQKTGEFTVNIALIKDHVPVLGVVFVPVKKITYWGANNMGAFSQVENEDIARLRTSKILPEYWQVACSRRHGDNERVRKLMNALGGKYGLVSCGSTLKICLLAADTAHIYPRFGPTGEWDTAAGQCILEQAGGALIDEKGRPLEYGTRESLINPSFIGVSNTVFIPSIVDGLCG